MQACRKNIRLGILVKSGDHFISIVAT